MARPPIEYPDYHPKGASGEELAFTLSETTRNLNRVANRSMRDVKTQTADYTLDPVSDRVILVDTSGAGATVTITLPDPDTADHCVYTVVTIDATRNVTVDGGSGNINGAATVALNTQYDALNVVSDGTNYFRID